MRSKHVMASALALLLCAGLAGLRGGTAHAASNASVRVIQAAVGIAAAAMPGGPPQTGFNPHPQAQGASSAQSTIAVWALVPVLVLLLPLAVAVYPPGRRRLAVVVKRG